MLKILFVDDEPDVEILIRQRFRKKIREKEFGFVFAGNGHEALEQLEAHPDVELILTDINMPGMDGLTLLSKIKDMERPLKAVVISAYGDIDNIRSAMNKGAFDFLIKPIDLEDLDITIARARDEIANIKTAQETRERLVALDRELSVASQIQQAMLPQTFPPFPGRKEFDIYAKMLPAKAVGGDFYDFFLLEEDLLGLLIGDVSGKGVPAALLMSLTLSLTKAIAKTGLAPGECMAHVNRILSEDNDSMRFVTLFYAILRISTGQVDYCNAGHNPPFVLATGGAVRRVESIGGMVLGVGEDAEYESGAFTLAPGDGLFLYTDGVTEAMNRDLDQYSEDRLGMVLKDAPFPADALIHAVFEDVESFSVGRDRHDDMTTLALRCAKD